MLALAVMSEKGGGGKSTTTINVAAALVRRGHRVLVIDADAQANTTMVFLHGRNAERPTLADVMLDEADAVDAIRPTGTRRLDLLPADASLADANLALSSEMGRERRLRLALEGVADDYDYVLVDTGPARSVVNVNVLNYVDRILVPVDPGIFALAGLGKLQEAVEQVSRYLDNRSLRIGGLVLTRVQANNVARDLERQLREMFGPLVYRTRIPMSVKVEESHARFLPVLDYAPQSPAARAYLALTEEIVDGRAQDGSGDAADGPAAADDAEAA